MNQSVISSKVRKEEKMNGVAQVFCPWQTLRRFGCFPEWESLKGWRKRVRPVVRREARMRSRAAWVMMGKAQGMRQDDRVHGAQVSC